MLLELKHIRKEFSGTVALDGVSLSLEKGEILGLCGENGAGKSTLMKILSGVYPSGSYEGEIIYKGARQAFTGIRDAQASGIRIIHQELALVGEFTVAENIYLGNEPRTRWGTVDWHKLYARAHELLQRYNFNIDPYAKVERLSVGEQQMVEIAKALSEAADIIIFDEPTSALTEREILILMDILRQLRSSGVAAIYISHKLGELKTITDRLTVIRDGKTVFDGATHATSEDTLVSKMVGRQLTDRYPKLSPVQRGEVLRVEGLSCGNPADATQRNLKKVSFALQKGEILGLAGLMGAGRSELALSIFGEHHLKHQGRIFVEGREVKIRAAGDAISHGIALLTEDRKRSGLVLPHSILHNMSLAALPKVTSPLGMIREAQEVRRARDYFEKVHVKAPGLTPPVATLSGGNQQKIVLSKWLNTEPRVLILDEPTRGVDVGAKFEIYKIIAELASEGLGILLISSELPELLGITHSIMVMHEGCLVGRLNSAEATEEKIMRLATGLDCSEMGV
jgi:D-xylose transport system ATP-binding protein